MKSRNQFIAGLHLVLLLEVGCAPPASTTAKAPTAASTSDAVQSEATVAADASLPEISVSIVDLVGLDETVKKLAGKPIVLDIWSTSCAPCMHEYPNLVALSQRFPDKLACISLNVDFLGLKSKPPESYLPAVVGFLKKQNSTLINLLSSTSDEEVLSKYNLGSMPAILIFSADGTLLHQLTDSNTGEDGLSYEGDVIPLVEKMLNE